MRPRRSDAAADRRCTGRGAGIVSTVLDFEQLAFIERWRQRAARGVVVALDGTRGDIVVTMRVGDLGATVDLRGRDATGAMRKHRLSIGDRVTIAIEYTAMDVGSGMSQSVGGGTVGPGAIVEGIVGHVGELVVVDCGAPVLVTAASLGAASDGDVVRFTVAGEGRAYLIPTR